MKNKSIIFIVVCMLLCLIPSVGMLFFPTTQTTENRAMAKPPVLFTEEESLNLSFFQDFESYFNEHMALRNQLVFADAKVQTAMFAESNVSGVISGTDGWLYYSSTLNDYLGLDVMTDRELFNLAHNISVVQDYLKAQNIGFVFTIAPNKNTLYPEHMPYYKDQIVNPDHSAKLLAPYLQAQDVSYTDLFALLESQEEVLYLLRDSHWNNKGALMAYNAIMDDLGCSHEDYASVEPKLSKNENGDLNKMLYSFYGPLEENYDYGVPQSYTYEKEDTTVEDGWIVTTNPEGEGSILMFRDSFGNTLIPWFSNAFANAYYSKGEPNAMESFVELYDPDYVVIQKVERNISDYLDEPPILTGPKAELPENLTLANTETTIQVEPCMYNANYIQITGTIDPERMTPDTQVLIAVGDTVHRAYHTGEDKYLLYLKTADLAGASADVQVYLLGQNQCIQALSETLEIPQ